MNSTLHVALTGAAGQIGYALAFRLASGAVFGERTPICLHLIEVESAIPALEGLVMELEDCAFATLKKVVMTANLKTGFNGVNWAFLVGSVPRGAGMERADLLGINGQIFITQGSAIAGNAASDVRVLVVGNPCNTNCLIAAHHARDVPAERFFAMTRLDENRAKAQLAIRAGVGVEQVNRMAIWGNHSPTMFPDFTHARIGHRSVQEVISDQSWLEGSFLQTVQNRGAAIIAARKLSSAASAANAIIDSAHSIISPTQTDDWNSLALISRGEYGVPDGLVFSFPTRSDGDKIEIVQGLEFDDFARDKIAATTHELETEREMVRDLLV